MSRFEPSETARIATAVMARRMRQRVVHGASLALTGPAFRQPAERPIGAIHKLALFFVSLTIFSGFFVVFEPAPYDALMIGLMVLLPTMGLTALNRPLLIYLVLWLLIVVFGFIACIAANDPTLALPHMVVTLYLALSSVVLAAFVARRPVAHASRVLRATTAAALLAAVTGIAGYMELFPGAKEWFTLFDRATGSFKDPNVFAPFLVLPILFLLHQALSNRLRSALLPIAGIGVLGTALLLSFSRGSWTNLVVGLAVYAALMLLTARNNWLRFKLISMVTVVAVIGHGIVFAAIQSDSRLLNERAALTQSYDEGPEGRFGGQAKAFDYALKNPWGLGALQFDGFLHPEQPHNVYVSQFLNGGWIGGFVYLTLLAASLVLGFQSVLKRRAEAPLLPVAYAAFAGLVVEGMVVETDHWRIFYLVLGILWGLTFPVLVAQRLAAPLSRLSRLRSRDLGLPSWPVLPEIAVLPLGAPKRKPRIIGPAAAALAMVQPFKPKTRKREPKRRGRIVVH